MRSLMTMIFLLGLANTVWSQEKAPVSAPSQLYVPAELRVANIGHLLKAAEHLEAAGQTEEANKLRRQAEEERAAIAGDIEKLQEQIERLREVQIDVPQIVLHFTLFELSRTKLRCAGINLSNSVVDGDRWLVDALQNRTKKDHADKSNQLHVFNTTKDPLFAKIEALRKDGIIKVLGSPIKLVTTSNRPVSCHSGGEVPIPSMQANGNIAIEWVKYGRLINMHPVLLTNGTLRLWCRFQMSQLDPTLDINILDQKIPGRRIQQVDTALQMKSGQTIVLDGLPQTRTVKNDKGQEINEEVELLVILTAEVIETTQR